MMARSRLLPAAALLAAALLSGSPARATTAPSPVSPGMHYFATNLRETLHLGMPLQYQGNLAIAISNGIVSGYYRELDGTRNIPVQGGADGDKIWFNIGDSTNVHFEGHLANGAIDGGGWIGGNEFTLHAQSVDHPVT